MSLPAVRAIESGREFPVFVQEYECDIRQRLPRLAFNEDAWSDLDHQVSKTDSDITRYMDSLGLPFLEEFESHDDVLAVLDKSGSCRFPMKVALPLVGAMVCVHLRQLERARGYFDRLAAYASANKGFAGHVAEGRRDCGL